MIIGLTGGIASGKSLAAEYFRELGVPVIDTDDIARQVVAPGQPAWLRIRETFGPDVFTPDGQLDRPAMARRVFIDPAARRRLEAVTHPAIFAEVDRQIDLLQHASPSPRVIVVVVPLLFEVGAEERFDVTVLVKASPEQQRARLQQLRGYSAEEADNRITAQLPLDEKCRRADYCLDNSGEKDALRRQVVMLLQELSQHA